MRVPIPEDHSGRAAYLAERATALRDTQCRAAVPRTGCSSHLRHQDWSLAAANNAPAAYIGHTWRPEIAIVGTQGGAGTSTVARLLNAIDAGRAWPNPCGQSDAPTVVLTARTNASGLAATSRALAGYCATDHPEGPFLAGFVLVPDAPGRLPKNLNRRIAILASATMVYRLPWVRQWRLCEIPPDQEMAARLAPGLLQFAERAALAAVPAPPPLRGCTHRRY